MTRKIEVAGVPLALFEDHVHAALAGYSDITDGAVTFDPRAATEWEVPPADKHYSARSTSHVSYLGETANLVLVAFAPDDGTGNDKYIGIDDIDHFESFPRTLGSLPRLKTAIREVHLTVAAALTDQDSPKSVLYGGSLDLVGHDPSRRRLVRLGVLGQDHVEFRRVMHNGTAEPQVTTTVGYIGGAWRGNPHAVVNARLRRSVHVGGFIDVQPGDNLSLLGMFSALGADALRPAMSGV